MITLPVPEHFLQAAAIMVPLPLHCGQVVLMLKKPLDCVTCPRPLQRLHVCGAVPGAHPDPWHSGQAAYLSNSISVFIPSAASMKDICKSYRKSAPTLADVRARERPVLKPKTSPKTSPKLEKMSSNPENP